MAEALVFDKVRKTIGLDRCFLGDRCQLYSGAAPASKESLEYLASLGLCVSELYGMSECTGGNF